MVSSPLQWQKEAPTRDEAEAFLEARIQRSGAPISTSFWPNPSQTTENCRSLLMATVAMVNNTHPSLGS